MATSPSISHTKRHVLITGASGGLGSALAMAYAEAGTYITLWGRNQSRLDAISSRCREQGATTKCICQDTRDARACAALLKSLHAEQPIDMAILGAGVTSGTLPDGRREPADDACRTMAVNATATIAMTATLTDLMCARGNGHIILISSLAAFYPLPLSPSYCASKTAVSCYGRALRMSLASGKPRITIVYPGYIATPMTDRLSGPHPMLWSADKAAAHIKKKMDAGKNTIVFPWLLGLGTWLLNTLPAPLAAFFAKKFSYTVEPDSESPLADGTPNGHDDV